MTNNNPLSISHQFHTSAENVFAAWSDPEQLKQWYAPKDYTIFFAETDIKPNGTAHYCLASKSGLEIWHKLFFQEIIPPAKLVLAWCRNTDWRICMGGLYPDPDD